MILLNPYIEKVFFLCHCILRELSAMTAPAIYRYRSIISGIILTISEIFFIFSKIFFTIL